MNNLLALTGQKGSGKDTVATIITLLSINKPTEYIVQFIETNNKYLPVDCNYEIKKFAQPIKEFVANILGVDVAMMEDREFKETPLGEEWKGYEYSYWDGDTLIKEGVSITIPKEEYEFQYGCYATLDYSEIHHTPRTLMQLIGTEVCRQIHPDFWLITLFKDFIGDKEEWRNIEGYENKYQISNFGNVRSLDREIRYGKNKGDYHTRKSMVLKPSFSNGYLTIGLSGKTFTIHSLVAKAFLDKPEDATKFIVNHKDNNRSNNFYKNLQWVTIKENVLHTINLGKGNIGEKQADSKLKESDVKEIKKLLQEGKFTQRKIAELYNVSPTTITDIKKGRKWKHVSLKIKKEILPIQPKPFPKWIISDCRFNNEAEAIKSKGGVIIKVERDLDNQDSHKSEKGINDNYVDLVINNNSSIQDLITEVKNKMNG